MVNLRELIQETPNFPKEGILFRDFNPIARNPQAWERVLEKFEDFCNEICPQVIVGIEARGFIIGASLATRQQISFVPIRKTRKLPGETIGVDYTLEYGEDRLEIQANAFPMNSRVLIMDDLLATGGTAKAASELIKKAKADLVGYGFIIELTKLNGRNQLPSQVPIKSLICYD